jgi:hypothetical protein
MGTCFCNGKEQPCDNVQVRSKGPTKKPRKRFAGGIFGAMVGLAVAAAAIAYNYARYEHPRMDEFIALSMGFSFASVAFFALLGQAVGIGRARNSGANEDQ